MFVWFFLGLGEGAGPPLALYFYNIPYIIPHPGYIGIDIRYFLPAFNRA